MELYYVVSDDDVDNRVQKVKGKILKNPKCNKPFKWEGFEIKFEPNPYYGKGYEKSKNRNRLI